MIPPLRGLCPSCSRANELPCDNDDKHNFQDTCLWCLRSRAQRSIHSYMDDLDELPNMERKLTIRIERLTTKLCDIDHELERIAEVNKPKIVN